MAFIHRKNYKDLSKFNPGPLIFYLNISLIFVTNLLFIRELKFKVPNCNDLDQNMDSSFEPSSEQMD